MKQLENKWDIHIKSFRLRVEELQKKMTARQTKQREELVELNNTHTNALKDRGNSELTSLFERSALDEKKIIANFRQFADGRGDLQPRILQMRNTELHKHRKKVEELKGNLENKVRELLAESEADHKKKFLKLEKHHHRRKAELNLAIRKLSNTCHARHEQLKIHRMKSHDEKFEKMEEEIRNRETAFRPMKPMSLMSAEKPKNVNAAPETVNNEVGAFARLKRRKSLLMKTPTFMTVEIHNEGLNVSCRNENFNGGETHLVDQKEGSSKISNDFIPFGYSARKFLHSILSGEIPTHGIIDHRLIHQMGLQGQIKCLVADMRVPTHVALKQRLRARQGSGIEELSHLADETKATLSQDIKEETVGNETVKRSLKTLEKAKLKLSHLRSQTESYLKKEGSDKANSTENFKKLSKIYMKCEGVVKSAENQHKLHTQKLSVARAKRIQTTEEYKRVSLYAMYFLVAKDALCTSLTLLLMIPQILQEFSHAKKFHSRELDSREYNEDDNLMNFLSAFHKVASERRTR